MAHILIYIYIFINKRLFPSPVPLAVCFALLLACCMPQMVVMLQASQCAINNLLTLPVINSFYAAAIVFGTVVLLS